MQMHFLEAVINSIEAKMLETAKKGDNLPDVILQRYSQAVTAYQLCRIADILADRGRF